MFPIIPFPVLPTAGQGAAYLGFLGLWLGFEERPRHLPGCRMKVATSSLILWLSLGGGLAQSDTSPDAEESYSNWGLRHIRGSFESVNSYFDSFLELLGGKNGVCQYRCRYGECTVSSSVASCRWTCEQLRRVTASHELFCCHPPLG